MYLPKLSTQRFCSYECQSKWQKTLTGELNPRYKKVKTRCDYCGKEINVFPYKIRDKENHSQEYVFCDENCRKKWYANVFSQTKEWKDISRIRAVKILSEGKIPQTLSSIQIIINNLLDRLNVNYINEYNCKYYSVDNYLTDYNLMIEVMGDYWHTNPTIYPTIKYEQRFKGITRDKRKRTYIKNKYGINILYLWEYDINNHLDVCERCILEYINNKGLMNNYNSFNYYYINNEIKLNENIIFPYYEMDLSKYKDKLEYKNKITN